MAHTVTRHAKSPRMGESAQKTKIRKLRKLLETWLADESGYDERVWPIVKKAIEDNRPSYRKRFRD